MARTGRPPTGIARPVKWQAAFATAAEREEFLALVRRAGYPSAQAWFDEQRAKLARRVAPPAPKKPD